MELTKIFQNYALSFLSGREDFDRNIELKRAHSFRVMALADKIASSEQADGDDLRLAVTAGLLHDYGRFEQYRRFETFADARSVDHGELGAELLAEHGLLSEFKPEEAEQIIAAVRCHNMRVLPEDLTGKALWLTEVVRDADKIDIIELVLKYYVCNLDNPQVTLGLSPERRLSPDIVRAAISGEPPNYRDLRTFYDFAVTKLSWFSGLYFDWSRREFLRRAYPDRIAGFIAGIPGAEEVIAAFKHMVENSGLQWQPETGSPDESPADNTSPA